VYYIKHLILYNMEATINKPKRRRFNHTAVLVGSSNIVRVSLARRFSIIVRYKEEIFSISHSTLTFNRHE